MGIRHQYQRWHKPKYEVGVPVSAAHAAFSDEELIVRSADDPDSTRFGAILCTVAEILQAFFDETLASKRGSVLHIVESKAGVTVESFGSL